MSQASALGVLLLVLVLLSGGDAELPDVGRCKFMEYYCSTLNCSTALVKELQRDPSGNCR